MEAKFVKLRRRQLDRRFKLIDTRQFEVPKVGFLREIRNALGMTATQFAKRLSVTPAAVNKIEHYKFGMMAFSTEINSSD